MNIEGVNRQGLAFETVHYAAVNGHATPEEIKAAEEFLDWLVTSEKGMDFLVNKLNVIAPFDNAAAPSNPLAANALHWLRSEGVTNAVTWSVLTPGEEFRDRVVGTGLLAYHRGESNWEKFRDDIREGWEHHRARMDEHA
jgi:raffinose/stachyose/melibiose transport system substrate-binding protein